MINTVQNIDCLEGMKNIPDKSIDMILCDLPYGTTACKWDVIIPFEPLWEQYERIIKDNGAIVLTASQPFTTLLINSKIELFKYDFTWDKKLSSGFLNSNVMPLRRHEDILVFGKSRVTYNPQMRTGLMRVKGMTTKGDTTENYGTFNRMSKINNQYYPTSIIEIGNTNRSEKVHPTQKPVTLFEYLIKTYTNERETVLDNCMGSGTTAIACINTNRNYIGFEKEEKYYNIIQERIKKHTPQLALAI